MSFWTNGNELCTYNVLVSKEGGRVENCETCRYRPPFDQTLCVFRTRPVMSRNSAVRVKCLIFVPSSKWVVPSLIIPGTIGSLLDASTHHWCARVCRPKFHRSLSLLRD